MTSSTTLANSEPLHRKTHPAGQFRRGSAQRAFEALLAPADIRLDGKRPWDIVVHDTRLARRVLTHGSLGAGEAYMDGWWDCQHLDEMFTRLMSAQIDSRIGRIHEVVAAMLARLRNSQTRRRAFQVGEQHYDAGDDLYAGMLDASMTYSCGYWRRATDLGTAQQHKLELVCRKLGLQPGMRVLDIGCGWGGAAQFAAERYGVSVTGLTVSRNQAASARARCQGLPVQILLQDYRDLHGTFDHIYSIGMFEHVGSKNHRAFFAKTRELLAPNGLFLLHTIGSNWSSDTTDPWIEKYIFPNSVIPSLTQIAGALEHRWVIEDLHGFGPDYDRTLMAWLANFDANWPTIAPQYGDRFRRMWRYYLTASAASFRTRRNQLWQLVLSPHGVPGGLAEVR
jgi:cyclopropane-fatty-acyl-phospholipid synthase